jgi:hypothetical protein
MNTTELQRKLIAAAKAQAPADHVPYAFEKRVMAHLQDQRTLVKDVWAAWASGLWRAAVPCVGLTLALSAWVFFATAPSVSSNDLPQDLDNTLLAAAVHDQVQVNW